MHNLPHEQSGDLLFTVADMLDSIAGDGGEGGDVCRVAGAWVRDVRAEMLALVGTLAGHLDRSGAIRSAAEAVNRIVAGAEVLAAEALRSAEGSTQPPDHRAQEGPASYVQRTESIRADVASFREQLRADRAELARKAAEERKRFVEGLRREPRAEPSAALVQGQAQDGDGVEPATAAQADAAPESSVGTDAAASGGNRAGPTVCDGAAPVRVDAPGADPFCQVVLGSLTCAAVTHGSVTLVPDPAAEAQGLHPVAGVSPATTAGVPRFRRIDASDQGENALETPGIRFRARAHGS